MANEQRGFSRNQRSEIMRAVDAIERQLKALDANWQSLYVISTNLTIIRANVADQPGVTRN